MNPTHIVFFDGHCGLCNRVVRWLVCIDRQGLLHYAPLEGETAKRLLPRLPEDLDAIVYWREGKAVVDTSNAIGAILGDLTWPWAWGRAMLWVPQGLRDWAYRVLASRRYRLFGHYETCPVPEAGIRGRFLE